MADFFAQGQAPLTFPEILHRRAESMPQRLAYRFLLDGEREERTITYSGLERKVQAVASRLRSIAEPGSTALLLHPPGLDFIIALFGCFYAGLIAVPAYPPLPARINRGLIHFARIAQDASVRLVLTTAALLRCIQVAMAGCAPLSQAVSVATDLCAGDGSDFAGECDPDAPAILQYTSGSTSHPRGVELTHGNLIHNSRGIYRLFHNSTESIGMIWLPPYHDMGLIGGILQPMFGGFPVTLMSPLAFVQRPVRWLQAISRTKATGSGGPNFAYDLCVRKVSPEQRATLDLSSWKVAFNGAEPIRPETLRRFAAVFAECGFHADAFLPCYGLAEATLLASGGTVTGKAKRVFSAAGLAQNRVAPTTESDPEAREMVGLGCGMAGHEIAIVDPESCRRCRGDQVGEIWLKGPSVARGYWNRPRETSHSFGGFMADSGKGPFLRTGDLGFQHLGELFVVGRVQNRMVFRGQNHYAEDVEMTLEGSHTALRPGSAAAFAVEVHDEERLIIMAEVERSALAERGEVEAAIRRAISETHGLAVHAVWLLSPGAVPKTASGKVQRGICRDRFLHGSAMGTAEAYPTKAGRSE